MRQEFSYHQVVHLNASLHQQHMPYRIHFQNAQTMVLVPMGVHVCDGKEEPVKRAIKAFFQREGMKIMFSEDNDLIFPAGAFQVADAE